MAITAAIYAYTIFSNFCMDQDTLNYVASLQPLKDKMTFLNCIAISGWFAKFHLLMFSLVYLVTRICSFWGPWDYLMGFKISTLISALATIPLLFFICRHTMRHFWIMLIISLMPLYVLGYSWLITTCDDNVIANFFNLLFVISVLVATGAVKEVAREKHPIGWAFLAGIAGGLSVAAHMKNIVALPLILSLAFVRPPSRSTRLRVTLAGLAGLLFCFGSLYGIYWIQSVAEPVSSKLDFWVFHRVPGRFYLTPPRCSLTQQIHLAFIGIRSSLYGFQEIFINTDCYDRDILGYLIVALFFCIYFAAAFRTRERRAVKILFALFLLDAGHSFLYDTWVVERWDSFTLPVFITIGIYWDTVVQGGIRPLRFSALMLVFLGSLVWSNIHSTCLLIGITNNSIPFLPSAKKWPYETIWYFYFDHRGLYDLAKTADSLFGEGTYFLMPRPGHTMGGPNSHVYGIFNRYLNLYSRAYSQRGIENTRFISPLVNEGKLKKLLYFDMVKIPWYVGTARSCILFDPTTTKTVYENSQMVIREASFGVLSPPQGSGAR
ncbi:MAG: hypothetical protein NT045_02345 [Candidatus Aureabacteria bacterium]|nr:hypothetical protein [Candidatus Auribacterota bacterium]